MRKAALFSQKKMRSAMNVSAGNWASVRVGLYRTDRKPVTVLSDGRLIVARTAFV
jgi:hypothetical protein